MDAERVDDGEHRELRDGPHHRATDHGRPNLGDVASDVEVEIRAEEVDLNREFADAGEPATREPDREDGGCGDVREDGPGRSADRAHPEPEDEHGVEPDVEHRTATADGHRRPRVVDADEDTRADEVQRGERDSEGDDPEVVRADGDGVAVAAHERDERLGERREQDDQRERDGDDDEYGRADGLAGARLARAVVL